VPPPTTDFVIVGGGVVGLTVALEVKRRLPGAKVTVLEKEPRCGAHASTRNSGVLHAGFYYTPGSLKARFTVDGNRRLRQLCVDRGLAVNQCGKLVVARTEQELLLLSELASRGQANGCPTEIVDETTARELEPRVRTVDRALFSPTTASVNPHQVMATLEEEAVASGVRVRTTTAYRGKRGPWSGAWEILTSAGALSAGYLINTAGLYADRVAHDFGFGTEYAILPFKGIYLYADVGTESLRRHVYPVPDLTNQFHLGVHFTVSVEGRTKLGPTAIPAFWREHYAGWRNFRFAESAAILAREARLFLRNDFGFRRLALEELRKYSRRRLVGIGATLLTDLSSQHYRAWGPAGIRAQLFNRRTRRLVLDFKLEGDRGSMHVLNAVSPAFTCCLPFAEYVVDRVDAELSDSGSSAPPVAESLSADSKRGPVAQRE
jgi:(S)-2-hydroxyglutarate dehydrogenase